MTPTTSQIVRPLVQNFQSFKLSLPFLETVLHILLTRQYAASLQAAILQMHKSFTGAYVLRRPDVNNAFGLKWLLLLTGTSLPSRCREMAWLILSRPIGLSSHCRLIAEVSGRV